MRVQAQEKLTMCKNQQEKHWIDGDYLWQLTNADPLRDGWVHNFEAVMEVNNRSDVMTYQAKKQGLWIRGSSNSWLKPDAIVILDESVHKSFIEKRESGEYDGGAKEEDFEAVKRHDAFIMKWSYQGVPVFSSIQEVAEHFIAIEA